ncbi:hypothetical protein BDR26DRAFT_921587 [Obelidium mucronatum]|nr:hypothetical protein BDR26DRAFT_921587 [Obelidium mucronatum]
MYVQQFPAEHDLELAKAGFADFGNTVTTNTRISPAPHKTTYAANQSFTGAGGINLLDEEEDAAAVSNASLMTHPHSDSRHINIKAENSSHHLLQTPHTVLPSFSNLIPHPRYVSLPKAQSTRQSMPTAQSLGNNSYHPYSKTHIARINNASALCIPPGHTAPAVEPPAFPPASNGGDNIFYTKREPKHIERMPNLSVTPSNEESFVCNWPNCKKHFTSQWHLLAHMNTHSVVRQHACALCPLAFARKHDLTRHERSVHAVKAGVPVFTCPICSKGYGRMDSLKRHIDSCRGVSPT